MTQEEAIKRIKDWNLDNDKIEVLSVIIPELKESDDERIRKEILEYFSQFENGKLRGVDISSWIAWLENLEKQKEREPIEQNPAWSEEDESILQNILVCLKNGWRKIPTDLLKYESWLKSLKDRMTWKPSDEQMKLLKEACDKHWEPDGLDPLYTLYQDLKKLKGE